jgi:hypothetical protein
MRLHTAKMPPVLLGVLEALRAPHEKSYAAAKMRLALQMNYNVQTIMHWSSGRRPIGPVAQWELDKLHRELTGRESE